MHHHREKSISGIIGDRLGHGKFGDWIKLEFDWSQSMANKLMTIASQLNSYDHTNLPTGMNPAYALASAMAKTDEESDRRSLPTIGNFYL